MGEHVLELTDLTVRIGTRPILSDVSLRLAAGTWHGLVGPNGSGKTTLMRAALGLLRPTAGTVRLLGAPPPYRPGQVAASFGPRLTHPRRRARTELWLRIAALGGDQVVLEQAWAETGLSDKRAYCGDLSLGQAQRLAIVAALVAEPRLVVLDEPTVGLDAQSVDWLRCRLSRYVTAGGCVWISSHDIEEVERNADEIAVLSGGGLAYAGAVPTLVGTKANTVRLRSSDPIRLHQALSTAGLTFDYGDQAEVTVLGCNAVDLGRLLAAHQVPLVSMTTSEAQLETALTDLYAVNARTHS